ncbi:YfdX family protein [Nitrosophilus kaiyonis]|uniref:YfdX family protein n=1 Tax=Nitrosophilus kaiyonis TaxID=2930200 RepID=UPI00248F516F|nr:YfdX family protein [Nitrosophilus kaiyonis]
MKKFLISIATATLLVNGAFASVASKAESNKAISQAKTKVKKEQKELKIVQEAVDAVTLTNKVLAELEKGNKDQAIKYLEDAIGKLEVVLSTPNAPALIPINSSIEVVDFPGTLQDIKTAIISVKALLKENRIQEARRILDTLRSEIVFKVINLPLASYPAALKLAAKFLHENRVDEAKIVLNQALTTFVEVDVITPIPLLQAIHLVEVAKDAAKKDKKKALDMLAEAKKDIKRAEALGYTSDSDTTYKMLNELIEKVEKEIKGKNEAQKLFEELLEKLKEFKEKAVKKINK